MRRNEEVARLLMEISELLAVIGESPFRVRAYAEAARHIEAMAEDVDAVYRAGRIEDVPGIGPSIAGKIGEYLTTGRSGYYEKLKRQMPHDVVTLLEIPGVGPARARLFYERLGITSVAELLLAAQEHRLRGLPGIGETLEQRIATEAARLSQRARRLLLGVALPAAEEVQRLLRDHPAVSQIEPAGSIRRMKETVGDIDILAATDDPAAVADAFTTLPIVAEVIATGTSRPEILTRDGLQIDLRLIPPAQYGSALQYFTGSKEHNIALRSLAISRGWRLSEYGLVDRRGRVLAGRTEHELYEALGLDWIPPELREDHGEIEAARQHRLPDLINEARIQGDLHVHTDWSDGLDSLEQMVEAAIARGYRYLAITDHSPSLGVAHGLTEERVREQRQDIDRLNERYAPFRILHGTEVDILADGSLDYPDHVLAQFDIVFASVHSAFNQGRDAITARIVRAIRHPLVDALGHPQGRLLLRRRAYDVKMDDVLTAAVEAGVAVEVNGQPSRLDLDDVWARHAQEMGAMLVCTSDAHAATQLANMRYSVVTARRGWVEAAHVLNARPLSDLLAHLKQRKATADQRVRRSR
jgi:DNA polymerase (family 10)